MSHLEFRGIHVRFGSGRSSFDAVRGVDLDVPDGSIVGLVGESGSGKSTLARAAVGLHEPIAGEILLDGVDVAGARGRLARTRRSIQMVFQDPNSCLDPRMHIGASIGEALEIRDRMTGDRSTTASRRARTAELLGLVELDPARADDLPATLSGGQRQRVALARALAAEPKVLLADEITSALDVSVQGTVLNLLRRIHTELGLTVLFISHNLAVVRQLCDDVAVMKDGIVVEHGPAVRVIDEPREPYTRDLMSAVPSVGIPLFGPKGESA